MSEAPPVSKWRYGARAKSGHWLFPKTMWEYSIEKAKAAGLRQWPYQDIVGVEPQPPETGARWIHERNKGWRVDDLPTAAELQRAPGQVRPIKPAPGDLKYWWKERE